MRRLIFILFLLACRLCLAQQIEVLVQDNSGQKLSNINVQLLNNETTIDFQTTNDKGICHFTIKEVGIYTLKMTSLNYKTAFININTSEKKRFEVTLEESFTEIKEVVIKARPKISKIKGDTISFNIESIKDGTERTAEDLIRKIPGLDISENGKVTHNGNIVGQVLIDGNEFFGKNHKMATQNITSDMLEGIDLWNNYTTMSGNSSTAINLKLKDNYKNKITGNAEANYGSKKHYLAHSNLFNFGQKGNIAFVTDFNNIAQSPISLMDFHEMNRQEETNNTYEVSAIHVPSFINNDDKIASRNNQFGALQYSKSWGNFSVSAFSILNYSSLAKESLSNRIALEEQSNVLDFEEHRNENNNGYFGNTQIKMKKRFDDKSFIYYKLDYNPIKDTFKENTNRFAQNSTFFDINNTVYKNIINQYFTWNKPLFDNTKIIWSAHHITENFDENLQINANQRIFNINSNSILQYYTGNVQQSGISLQIQNKNKWINATFKSEYNKTNINTSLKEQHNLTSDIQHINYHHFINQLQLSKSLDRFHINAFLTSNITEVEQQSKHYFEYAFKIRYQPSSKINTQYGFGYNQKHQLPQHNLLFNNHLYTKNLSSYYSTNLTPLSLSKTDEIEFTWSRFNTSKGNSFFLLLKYSRIAPSFSSNTHNYNIFSEIENIAYKTENQWFLLFSNHQYINDYLTLKTNLIANHNNGYNLIDNNPNRTRTNITELKQQLSSNFKEFPIQFDLGYKLHIMDFLQTFYQSTSKNQNLRTFLGLKTNINNQLKANLLGEYLIQKTSNNDYNNFLLGGHFSYHKEGSSLAYSLLFNNILNISSFYYINSQLSSFGYQENITQALKGYIMAGIKYYF
ncbi:MAG: hypothetical protein Q4B43_02825 [Bacteroidota bacterium]|nr:hypothetical protein [Bacteroidota bacterium]